MFNVDVGDASTSELVVELEQPARHLEVLRDELSQTLLQLVEAGRRQEQTISISLHCSLTERSKFILVDVVFAWRDVHLCTGKYSFRAGLGRVEVGDVWLGAEDGYAQEIGHGEVVLVRRARHDVGFSAANEIFDALQCCRTVLQQRRQTHLLALK